MRATQSALIGLATATRFTIFLIAGSYSDLRMIAMQQSQGYRHF